ncbi:O-acetyl-ADP-ribose deacetylase [bacterium]|nr:O-acetyl-ADP-ribose deacetylase [bacterium]
MLVEFAPHRLQLVQGDITRQSVDAIVNAANAQLQIGGGVDGAIHRAGGPAIIREIESRYPDGCPTGQAVATTAGNLPAKYVFHAVGPVWRGGHQGEPELLRSCYRVCLQLAFQHSCQSIAFPAISTGIYGYPLDLAAETALDEIRKVFQASADQPPLEVRMVLFDAGTFAAFARVLETLLA